MESFDSRLGISDGIAGGSVGGSSGESSGRVADPDGEEARPGRSGYDPQASFLHGLATHLHVRIHISARWRPGESSLLR